MGMRDVRGMPSLTWPRLLHWRLTGQHHRALEDYSGTTQRIEVERGVQPGIYFFLGRCEPHYGDLGLANRPPRAGSDYTVAPFDTGGVASGRTKTSPTLSVADRHALIQKWSFTPANYQANFASWGARAYASCVHYTRGERPTFHLVSEIDLTPTGGNDSHAWDWEGRLAAEPASCLGVEPTHLVLSTVQLEAYRTWLRDEAIMSPREYSAHMDFVARIRIDPGGRSAATVLNSILEGMPQW